MDKKVTILVNSCDKYEDAWEPFFRLLKIHWPECENYRIILNSENKIFNCDYLNIETICGGSEKTWSKRLKDVLKQIETPYVVSFLEDFFLENKVDHSTFIKAINKISMDDHIGYIGLKYNPNRKMKNGSDVPSNEFISRDDLVLMCRISFMTVVWDRKWLIRLIREHESPWEFELYGSYRSKRFLRKKVLDINNNRGICSCVFDYSVDVTAGRGIYQGRWLPRNKELFEKYGIEVNFDNLGIDYTKYIKPENMCGKEAPRFNQLRLKEQLYIIKKLPKKYFRKIKKMLKHIKNIRSLVLVVI